MTLTIIHIQAGLGAHMARGAAWLGPLEVQQSSVHTVSVAPRCGCVGAISLSCIWEQTNVAHCT